MKRTKIREITLKIKSKLILSFLSMIIIPSMTIGFLSYNNASDEIENQMMYAASENVKLLDQYITNTIEPKITDVNYFSDSIFKKDIQGEESPEIIRRFNQYSKLHPETVSIYFATSNGLMIQNPRKDLPADYDPRERPWYIEATKNQGQVVITDAYFSASGDFVVTIARTSSDGSGVIGINLKMDNIHELTRSVHIGKEGYAILLGKEKQYISHPTVDSGVVPEDSFFDRIYKDKSGEFDYKLENRDKKMSFTTNEITGWKIAGTMYTEEVDKAAAPILLKSIITQGIAILIGILVALIVTRSITVPINKLKKSASLISQGDLTEKIDLSSRDEIGELADDFQHMTENLRQLLYRVDVSTEQVAAASEELTASSEQTTTATVYVASAIQQVASGAESQTNGIEKTADSIDEIGRGMERITQNSVIVNERTKETAKQAEDGGESVRRTVEQMKIIYTQVSESDSMIKTLNDRSKKINEIINVISGIANQTNLLALNAAIEAARAGEHGKGFAVVADEVRKLAEQSQVSAQQITALINDIQLSTEQSVQKMAQAAKSVESGMEISNDTIQKFGDILNGVRTIAPQIEEVSIIAKQVSSEVQTVTATTHELASIAKENSAASESVAASTEEQIASLEEVNTSAKALSSMAEELQELVNKFKLE